MGRRVVRTRNNGEWTESRYMQQIRSALRNAFRYWKPAQQCKVNARRKYKGKGKRQKWEFQCKACKEWFKDKEVQIDHIIPAGSLKTLEDVQGFIERLSPEDVNAFQILCKPCHQLKSNEEKKGTI